MKNLIKALFRRFGYYQISDLQIGGHGGLCGEWMANAIMPIDWPYDLCQDCKHDYFTPKEAGEGE